MGPYKRGPCKKHALPFASSLPNTALCSKSTAPSDLPHATRGWHLGLAYCVSVSVCDSASAAALRLQEPSASAPWPPGLAEHAILRKRQ